MNQRFGRLGSPGNSELVRELRRHPADGAILVVTYTKQTNVPLWHYQCPDCGIGDTDAGHLHPADAIYCEVCLEDARHVRLRRWPAAEPSGPLPGG